VAWSGDVSSVLQQSLSLQRGQPVSSTENQAPETGTARVKRGMAEQLKGGVIMDVVTPEQAKIAEDAGAVAVMALERVPADIRKDGGVARMSDPDMIEGIIEAVSIPVMAKSRIGHFVEAQVLQALGVDYIDESEVLTPADEVNHSDKFAFTTPFVCGATNLGEALRRIAEGAAMIRSKGEAGTGNVVEAVRHLRQIKNEIARLRGYDNHELYAAARSCAPRTSSSRRSPNSASSRSCCSPPVAWPPRPTPP
jgi:pyridoxal 5'-phosphate synthase pdxS subunit